MFQGELMKNEALKQKFIELLISDSNKDILESSMRYHMCYIRTETDVQKKALFSFWYE